MKDTRHFKIRKKSNGLFATRNHGYSGFHWGKRGTIWRGAGPLKMAFNSSVKNIDWSECEIVVYEMTEIGTFLWSDFK